MRAIVIGGSMAGLLGARILSEHFDEVVVLDRDTPVDRAEPRKGVPQARHVHALLAAGTAALGDLFPDLFRDLAEGGARYIDAGAEIAWFNRGSWHIQARTGIKGYVQSRPFLEMHVRRQVGRIANVEQRFAISVADLLFDAERTRVTGVRYADSAGTQTELSADFVLDCSGRGSKSPAWLEAAGYQRPPLSSVAAEIGYSTCLYKLNGPLPKDWVTLLIYGSPPKGTRYGAAFLLENDLMQVTLVGQFKDYPPGEVEGFLPFARTLEHPALAELLATMTPVSEVAVHRFPMSIWQRYDKLQRFPRRYAVAGDAVMSVNPVYAQGMTALAVELLELRRLFQTSGVSAFDGDGALRFFRRAAEIRNAAWVIATGTDLAFPQIEGQRPPFQGFSLWYIAQISGLCSIDPEVLTSWLKVTHLQAPVASLFRPALVARVLKRALFGGRPLPVERPLRIAPQAIAAE